jgi:hypothetical protein
MAAAGETAAALPQSLIAASPTNPPSQWTATQPSTGGQAR